MYLLDTNVVSELRKNKPHGAVLAWVNVADDASLFLSAVTIGEIQAGIEKTRELDPAKAGEIEQWLELLAASYNVLPMDAAAFREWGRLTHRKSDTLIEDAMIAATARVHNLTVVTQCRGLQIAWRRDSRSVQARVDQIFSLPNSVWECNT